MKTFFNKTLNILKPYLVCVLLFIVAGFIFKTIETVWFCKYQETISFLTIIKSYFNIISVFCLYAMIMLPIYWAISLLSKKTAQIILSVFFAILISFEIGLYVYNTQAGVLMGRELIIRPISETLTTIRNSSNIVINIILSAIIIACFTVLPFLLRKVKIFNRSLFVTTSMIVIGIFSIFTLFYQRDESQITNNYLESKTYYFFSAITGNISEESEIDFSIKIEKKGIEKNEKLLKEYIQLYNNKNAANLDYPM